MFASKAERELRRNARIRANQKRQAADQRRNQEELALAAEKRPYIEKIQQLHDPLLATLNEMKWDGAVQIDKGYGIFRRPIHAVVLAHLGVDMEGYHYHLYLDTDGQYRTDNGGFSHLGHPYQPLDELSVEQLAKLAESMEAFIEKAVA